ncbi:hypothetical protein GL58_19350 [Comamonas testosteroni]|uniref:Uncharacterized protein n=1 Tax=Comamonas testosteroni TaxID=285 RepID=A0A0L7N8H6_COMTE|nr:hypothetical protein GL58_19350 [Comamonas testosteroni]
MGFGWLLLFAAECLGAMNRPRLELTQGVGQTLRSSMKKYQTEFKLAGVRSFLAGEGGAKLLARSWSVPEEKIRTWVSH